MTAPGVVTTVAGPEHASALAALFERADVPCHCRYYHFEGNANAWLDRCFHHVAENRDEMARGLAAHSEDTLGVIALSGEAVIGWLKITWASAVPRLYAQRLYKNLPCFSGPRDRVMAIGCTLVDPARRGEGVHHALLDEALRLARARGATAVEAFPRRAEGLRDAEVWTGPLSAFLARGFEIVNDFAPYPVLRKVVETP
ncbi:MAG TPA: GNAT family N-acetyltransferase [Polyangiaceae bacterium]|nr:GNAT family N-acetyltransferase [Polyangiaceae bacterium]